MEYCYCVVFDSGVLKFGRTANLHSRLSSHISNASIHGATCTAVVVGSVMDSQSLETKVIRLANEMLKKHHGNEYYLGDCDDAVSVMMRAGMTPTVATPTKDGSGLNFLVSRTADVAARYKLISESSSTTGIDRAIIRVLKSGQFSKGVLLSRLKKFERGDVCDALDIMVGQGIIYMNPTIHPRNGLTIENYSINSSLDGR